ncbi:heat shock 70 kDa 17 [Olea europaea subsp. europaea]|uniref:Heat shock 70 kDa 17 n=1 Tax=Olea europaea subsp. europaea TaxID=158383 RepID=A0A8S0UCD8_OLEEU|nr:heat shock 70 kDa 17 [Olea europaea subsp. europaea]
MSIRGATLQYGIDKDFSNVSRHVIFYDMGASSTYTALVYFSSYNAKEFGKTTPVNQFQLVEYFADEFNKQLGNGVDIRNNVKAMVKLKKQVKCTKEILSANTMAPISVESLYDDCDFRSTISREKFEELCEDLWDKALVPVMEVLKHSGLKPDDLYVVELIHGATRVPKLQAKLLELLGRKDLDKHLDADEAIVPGASLHAANLSDGIKLNRKLGMIDGSTYGFVIELDGPNLSKDENPRHFTALQMFRSIIYDKDFEVSLAYESEDFMPPGASLLTFAQYAVSGLTDSSEKYSSRNLSSPIKANLHFSLSRSGVFSLDRADAIVENGGQLEMNDSTSNSSISSVIDSATSDIVTEKKLKKRTFRLPLKVQELLYTNGEDASANEFLERLNTLKASGDPIFYRYNELTARPVASEHARRYLEEVISEAKKVRNWLNEKDAEQQKISGFSTPAFKPDEVYTKVFDLQDKVARINRIPKLKPKVEKPIKIENERAADKSNDKDTSSGETTSQKDQNAGESDYSAIDKNDESNDHDEL